MGLEPGSMASNVQGLTNMVYGGTLQLTNLAGPHPFPFGSYTLFYASNYSGAFNNLVPSTPGPGGRWDTSELTVDGTLRVLSANVPPPNIHRAVMIGGSLVLTPFPGVPYDPCYLLTSTNLAVPLANWACITTNYFDVNGNTSFTNAIFPGEPGRYFQLKVN
jgi:hypothetical protein